MPRTYRTRVETGIYIRHNKTGDVYEVMHSVNGKVKWHTVYGGIEEARALRQLFSNNQPEDNHIDADLLIVNRMSKNATPTKREFVKTMRETSGIHQRRAWLRLAALSLAMARLLDNGRVSPEAHICKNCGFDFIPKNMEDRFCSDRCRDRDSEARFRS